MAQVTSKEEGYLQQELISVPWGIMVGKHGGNEQAAVQSLEDGDIVKVKNERNGKWEYMFAQTIRSPLICTYAFIYSYTCTIVVYFVEWLHTFNQYIYIYILMKPFRGHRISLARMR